MCQGIRCDLVDPRNDIAGYKAVFTPFCPIFPDNRIDEMLGYVRESGTWVVGPLSMMRTEDLTVFRDRFFGRLEELAGFRVIHHVPSENTVTMKLAGGESSACNLFCDSFEVDGSHEVLAQYVSGALTGQMASVEIELGSGRLVLLGTWPDEEALGTVMKKYVDHGDCGRDFIRIRRVDCDGKLRAVIKLDLEAYNVAIEMVDENKMKTSKVCSE